ncbi:MAG: hypothetical protein WKF77_19230 [Planctomycetaceae bacterium]
MLNRFFEPWQSDSALDILVGVLSVWSLKDRGRRHMPTLASSAVIRLPSAQISASFGGYAFVGGLLTLLGWSLDILGMIIALE